MRQKTKKISNEVKKIFLIFISIILMLGFVYFLNNLEKVEPVKASPGPGHNVYGWAWAGGGEISGNATATIGWISFNCNNPELPEPRCKNNYGVNIDQNGLFSGYAWAGGVAAGSASGTIGWISFNTSDLTGCPSGTCEARLNTVNNQVSGWARALAATSSPGGWDGWIKLRHTTSGVSCSGVYFPGCFWGPWCDEWVWGPWLCPYTVTVYGVKLVGNEFEGWAAGWDDSTSTAVIGWISFNCNNPELPAPRCTNPYKVVTTLDLPPTATSTSVSQGNYCFATYPPVIFSWQFFDPGDTQSAYQVQIDREDDGIWDIDSGKIFSSSNSYAPTTLSYGLTNADWQVRVWDSHNATSSWADGPNFSTPAHAYPWPDFTPSPLTGTVDEVITFNDNSTCYSAPANTAYNCRDGGAIVSYSWNFGDGTTATTKGTATHTYDKTGKKTVTLIITDDVGTCETTREITILRKLPWWREILPF